MVEIKKNDFVHKTKSQFSKLVTIVNKCKQKNSPRFKLYFLRFLKITKR